MSAQNAASSSSPYALTIAMGTLDGMGRHLYSNSAAVLAELIANAWDADANHVTITSMDTDGNDLGKIDIVDDGCGMSMQELNSRFLTVGYRKREPGNEGQLSKKFARPYMGRKGLGKLSVFSIADTLTVISHKVGCQPAGFSISYPDVEKHCEENPRDPFLPTPISPEECQDLLPEAGTRIILTNLRKPFDGRSTAPLRTRIARRFDVFNITGDDRFTVIINDQPVSWRDRLDLQRCEYIWTLGDYKLPEEVKASTEVIPVPLDKTQVAAPEVPAGARIRGWIGTVKKTSQLRIEGDDETLRNIIVLARSRPIQEGILDQIDFHQLFANYVTGQLIADFLDDDDLDDIATSDRQRLLEDDPRVIAFKQTTTRIFKHASEEWSRKRRDKHLQTALGTGLPKLDQWLASLPTSEDRKLAKRLINVAADGELNENRSHSRTSLIQGAVLAYERMKKVANIKQIEQLTQAGISTELLLEMLSTYESYETDVYGQMIRDRITVINELKEHLDRGEKENATRDFVAQNPWLLNPAWDRTSKDTAREKSFRKIAADRGIELQSDDDLRRVDLAFLNTLSGDSIILEFKRPGVTVDYDDLRKQIVLYGQIMTEVLANLDAKNHRPRHPVGAEDIDTRIQFGVIVHRVRQNGVDLDIHGLNDRFDHINAEAFTFDQMYSTALERYTEYTDALTESPISQLLRSLDNEKQSDE